MPATRVDRLAEGVWTVKLVGGCYLDYHTPAVALDYMQLWLVKQSGDT